MLVTHAGALMPHIPPVPDTSVLLLMHFDGPSESNSFVDSSLYDRLLTPTAGPSLIDTPTLDGSTVGDFSGSGYVTADSSTDFDFGTGDFTIECFVYITVSGNVGMLFGNVNFGSSPAAGFYLLISGQTPNFYIYGTDTTLYTCPGVAVSLNAWHHLAVVRNGNNVRVYIDGGRKSLTEVPVAPQPSTAAIKVGGDPSLTFSGYLGYVDELRVTRGVARYSGDTFADGSCFSTPSVPFPNP